jgi:menaquinone-dependent protoporphyrinogen oxidase
MMDREEATMADKVLVAYGTKYGATAEIAERIAEVLRADGLDVDLVRARRVRSMEPYGRVVIGSAVYMARWRSDALRLLRRQKRLLRERDVWLFSSGPVGEDAAKQKDEGGRWVRPTKVQRLAEEIGAHDHAVFGGRVAEEGGFMRRNMAKGTPAEFRDSRDWDEIEAWAKNIVS